MNIIFQLPNRYLNAMKSSLSNRGGRKGKDEISFSGTVVGFEISA